MLQVEAWPVLNGAAEFCKFHNPGCMRHHRKVAGGLAETLCNSLSCPHKKESTMPAEPYFYISAQDGEYDGQKFSAWDKAAFAWTKLPIQDRRSTMIWKFDGTSKYPYHPKEHLDAWRQEDISIPPAPGGFSHSAYSALLQQTIGQIQSLSTLKGGEYAGDSDRLANFRRNAAALGLSMEQVWAVYSAKHWDALMQYIKDLGEGKTRERLEGLAGRADDLIVYLILFKAMLQERGVK
jgi:hypothetical protein